MTDNKHHASEVYTSPAPGLLTLSPGGGSARRSPTRAAWSHASATSSAGLTSVRGERQLAVVPLVEAVCGMWFDVACIFFCWLGTRAKSILSNSCTIRRIPARFRQKIKPSRIRTDYIRLVNFGKFYEFWQTFNVRKKSTRFGKNIQ